tara:strand:+ start:243 stop:548 length:306 start_codon:yes stop_codon:yes gene_type:complete
MNKLDERFEGLEEVTEEERLQLRALQACLTEEDDSGADEALHAIQDASCDATQCGWRAVLADWSADTYQQECLTCACSPCDCEAQYAEVMEEQAALEGGQI